MIGKINIFAAKSEILREQAQGRNTLSLRGGQLALRRFSKVYYGLPLKRSSRASGLGPGLWLALPGF